jgi:hypothetical protein
MREALFTEAGVGFNRYIPFTQHSFPRLRSSDLKVAFIPYALCEAHHRHRSQRQELRSCLYPAGHPPREGTRILSFRLILEKKNILCLCPAFLPAFGYYWGACHFGLGPHSHILKRLHAGCPSLVVSRKATAGEGSLYPWHIMLRSAPPAPLRKTLQINSFNGRPPPTGRLDNSELAAISRYKEYSVSLPLCLAGFWLIKGGVPFWPGAKIAHS